MAVLALCVGVALAVLHGSALQPAKTTLVYIGTYTGAKSKGIHVSRLDLASGALSAPALAAESANPSFLAVHPTRDVIYAVNEIGNYEGKPGGSVSAFAINRETGALDRVEPAVIGRRRAGAPHRGPCRQERARRQLRRRERGGAAHRRRRGARGLPRPSSSTPARASTRRARRNRTRTLSSSILRIDSPTWPTLDSTRS